MTTDEIDERELQLGLANRLNEMGWEFDWDENLDRPIDDVLRFSDVEAALIRLNPEISEDLTRVEQVFAKLRAILLAVENDGLVTTNQEFVAWMRGLRSIKYMGETKESQVRLIDFDDMSNNVLRCTIEATFSRSADHKNRRYDIVLWINGLPIVVGETKSPKNPNLSWLNGASDIHNAYEIKTKQFFVPNVLSFATEGREFRYGAIGQPPEMWLNWARTTDPMRLPGLPAVLRSMELLLEPQMVLDILRTFTLYTVRPTGGSRRGHRCPLQGPKETPGLGVASPGFRQNICNGVRCSKTAPADGHERTSNCCGSRPFGFDSTNSC
jgi:type I restriction enzyme R subunit